MDLVKSFPVHMLHLTMGLSIELTRAVPAANAQRGLRYYAVPPQLTAFFKDLSSTRFHKFAAIRYI